MAIRSLANHRFNALAERLTGEVVTPDHAAYDSLPDLERHDRQAARR